MAKKNVIDVLLKTISEVQNSNKNNPNQDTVDANVFDLLKDKLKHLDDKNRKKRAAKGKSPHSILDLIKKEIEGVKKQNKKDPQQKTAPKSVFEDMMRKVDRQPRKQAVKGIARIIQEYNLDVRNIPENMLGNIQRKYQSDCQNVDKQYAQAMHDLSKKYRR